LTGRARLPSGPPDRRVPRSSSAWGGVAPASVTFPDHDWGAPVPLAFRDRG
jgi:hypothetical protein